MSDDVLLERLAALDVCAVSDALDALGLDGAALGLGPMWAGARLVGRARTVRVGPATGSGRHIATETIADARPGDVVVIAGGGRTDVSCWGDILAMAAQQRRIAGVVVDGAVRDVDALRRQTFPAFARAAVMRTARGRISQVGADEPVDVAGVTVRPADLVIADGSGVVFVPADRAEEVLERAERLLAREQRILAGIADGESVVDLMSDASLTGGATS